MLKVAWAIGHNVYHRGAYSHPLKEWENKIATEVVVCGTNILEDEHHDIRVYTPLIDDPETMSSGAVLREKIRRINNWRADVAIESHFNSHSSKARGCETLYFSLPGINRFSKKGKILAELIQEETLYRMRLCVGREVIDRGAKGMASFTRIYNGKETIPRYAFLTKTKMPAVITEPLFISSVQDSWYLKNDREREIERLARSVVKALVRFKGVK